MPKDDFSLPPDEGDDERGDKPRFVQDFMRKAAVAGLGALFTTEEGVRNLVSQLKLPKDMWAFLASGAERTKDEIGRVLSDEIRRFFQSEKLRQEFLTLLQNMSLEIRAEISLTPKRDSPKGSSVEVQAKKGRRGKKE